MFKNRFQLNKETLIGSAIIFIFVVLAMLDVLVVVPAIQITFIKQQTVPQSTPINTETVNDAIELLAPN